MEIERGVEFLISLALTKMVGGNSDVDSFFKKHVNHINDLGIKLHENIYKVRIKNSNKQAGKSSGYGLITYVEISKNKINLLLIAVKMHNASPDLK